MQTDPYPCISRDTTEQVPRWEGGKGEAGGGKSGCRSGVAISGYAVIGLSVFTSLEYLTLPIYPTVASRLLLARKNKSREREGERGRERERERERRIFANLSVKYLCYSPCPKTCLSSYNYLVCLSRASAVLTLLESFARLYLCPCRALAKAGVKE